MDANMVCYSVITVGESILTVPHFNIERITLMYKAVFGKRDGNGYYIDSLEVRRGALDSPSIKEVKDLHKASKAFVIWCPKTKVVMKSSMGNPDKSINHILSEYGLN